MKRLIKWISFALIGLIILIIIIFGVSYYYKSDILAAVNAALTKNVNGDIRIGDIDFSLLEDFPSFSITLKDIYLRGEHYDRYQKDFIKAEKMSLDVQIVSFLQKEIVIRAIKIAHGEVFIFRAKNGYTNLDILKKNTQKDTTGIAATASITLKKIIFDDVHVFYQDSLREKAFGVNCHMVKANIFQTDSSSQYSLSGPVTFDELTFHKKNGSFLKEKAADIKLTIEFSTRTKNLIIHPSHLTFNKSDLELSGAFRFKNPGVFKLAIRSDNLHYQEGISLLPESIYSKLTKFNVGKTMAILATITGTLESGSKPSVDIQFKFADSRITLPRVDVERATVSGAFTDYADSTVKGLEKSLLIIHSFSGVIEGLPTKLTASFENLNDPYVTLHSFITLDLPAINEKLDTVRMKFLKGTFKSEINYSGKLSEYLDPDKTHFAGKLKGSVTLKDGAFDYKPRQQHIKKAEASIRFTKDSLTIDRLNFEVNKNTVSVQGDVLGFVPFFHQPEKKGYINLLITSPAFDLAAILSKNVQKKSTSRKSGTKKSISEMLDKLYTKVECDLTVQISKLTYQNFNGSNVRGRLLMDHNSLKAVNMKMKLADGNVNFTLGLNDIQRETKKLTVIGTVEHADIRQFFYAFNNFNQTTINHKNLEGKVKMNVKFNSHITDDFRVLPTTMKGAISLRIQDGKLEKFEPLQKMNNFLFKNRDFDAVQFGEINTVLTLEGPELDIERMEIESSVLRLFLEGRYSFADSTDLSIQLPLSNLKKRDKTYQPKNIGVDAKAGPSIFLHVYKDENGKTIFAYDPFKRHVRK